MTLQQLQREHLVWLRNKYPGQPAQLPAAGMVEEAGELLHAVLAKWREDKWGPDPRYTSIRADIVDAIGDCVIYLCSYCNTVDLELARFDVDMLKDDTAMLRTLAVDLVRTAADFYATFDTALIERYVALLKRIAYGLLIDFEDAIRTTWEGVKCR